MKRKIFCLFFSLLLISTNAFSAIMYYWDGDSWEPWDASLNATDLDIRNLSKALDEIYIVPRTDAGVAYDARDRNWALSSITDSINAVQSGTWNIGTLTGITNTVTVDGSGFTQPVSGTFWQATQPISAASLPLPSGAATSTNQSTHTNKFPSAAAMADNTANPTLTKIAAYLMMFDGSTWDRLLGDATNGLLVNPGSNNDVIVYPHEGSWTDYDSLEDIDLDTTTEIVGDAITVSGYGILSLRVCIHTITGAPTNYILKIYDWDGIQVAEWAIGWPQSMVWEDTEFASEKCIIIPFNIKGSSQVKYGFQCTDCADGSKEVSIDDCRYRLSY